MPGTEKPIRLSEHARQEIRFRGATEPEVVQTIRQERWEPAERGRLQCHRDFSSGTKWNREHHTMRKIQPVFSERQNEIVVVTVYVDYL